LASNEGARVSRRVRALVTAALVAAALGAALFTGALSRGSIDGLTLVDARLRETGAFSGARLRLQRQAFDLLPPQLSGDNVLVDDIRIQLVQARNLGPRLPDEILASIDRLFVTLSAPLVVRQDLVSAALLLESIVDAEALSQQRILQESVADVRRVRGLVLVGLLMTTVLMLVMVWAVPQRVAAPLRPLFRFWLRGALDQRRTSMRVERMALASEAAASLAHELRNPMAGVVLGLQNLERDAAQFSPRIRPLVEELERVTRTLGDHLDALRGPREELQDVAVGRMLTDLGELMRYEASPGVTVEVDAPAELTCRTRPDGLRQALLNLCLNSLQALEGREGTVRLEGQRAGGTLTLYVRDSGPGFPEAVIQGLSAPFASPKATGYGLGLRVVRRAISEMGGELILSNPPEGGAIAEILINCPDLQS
jgi:signal transduction histidine kinase